MKKKTNDSIRTLTGIVTPCAWDEHDQVSQVSLFATDDEEYRIENSGRFLDLVTRPIRTVGFVKTSKKAHRMINIKKFELLDALPYAE